MIVLLDRIRRETLELMNEKGINFTVAELAGQLAVSKRSIYDHFDSKKDLVAAVLDEILADLKQQVDQIAHSLQLDTIEKLKALMTTSPKALGPLSSHVITDIKRLLPEQWGHFEDFFSARWQEIEGLIEQGVEQGLFRPIDLNILHRVYRGAINELNEYQFLNRNNQTFHNAIISMTDILIYGVLAPDKQQPAGNCRSTASSASGTSGCKDACLTRRFHHGESC